MQESLSTIMTNERAVSVCENRRVHSDLWGQGMLLPGGCGSCVLCECSVGQEDQDGCRSSQGGLKGNSGGVWRVRECVWRNLARGSGVVGGRDFHGFESAGIVVGAEGASQEKPRQGGDEKGSEREISKPDPLLERLALLRQ